MKNLQRVVSVNQDSDKFSDIYRCRRPWLWAAVAAMVLWAAVVPAQAQVIDDPIAYWTFENGASGLVNQAVSGPYHDATVLSGEPAFGLASGEAGLVGNALVLDGASALRLPYHQDSLGQSFTISLWYWQSTNDTRMTVYQTKDTWNISCEATGNNSVFRNYVGESDAGAIQTGLKEWVHLVHAFATEAGNTTLKVYTNGVLASTKSVPSASVFELRQIRALYLGSYRDIGRYFKGMIDEIGLWNRTLSDQEVAALRQRGLAGSPLSVASNAWPRIELGSSQRSVTLNAEAQTPGVYQDGWLREEVLKSPYAFHLPDKAARQDDTAGNSGGPFHAEALGSKYRVPMTSALSQLTAGDFTLETRFRVTEGGRGIFMGNYSNNVINAVNLELAADNRVRLYVQPPSGETKCDLFASAGAVNLRAGAWHHLAGLRRSDVFYLYLDGVKIGQANDVAGAFSLGGPCYYLKNDSRSDATRFLGDMQNTRLWTRALTTNELFSLAAGALPGGGRRSHPAGCWPNMRVCMARTRHLTPTRSTVYRWRPLWRA